MTHDIPVEEWKTFFDDLSKRRFEWRTRVEIVSESVGDQTLSDRLPLNGISVEEKKGEILVEINVGFDEANHQTHTIVNPTAVRYKAEGDDPAGVVEFVEADGTKTLLFIIEPIPLEIMKSQPQKIARSG